MMFQLSCLLPLASCLYPQNYILAFKAAVSAS